MNKPKMSSPFAGRAAGKQRSRGVTLSIGALVVAIGAVMFFIGYNAPNSIPGRGYYTITAQMSDASNLEPHDAVKVGGVSNAGQVVDEKVQHHMAILTLQLGAKYGPLRSDSTIAIRLRSAVGVRFVDIHPGEHGKILPNGTGVLQATQTTTPISLDEALAVFDTQTRVRLREFIKNMGQGLLGRGTTVNETIGQAPALVSTLGTVARAINARTHVLGHLISHASELANTFEPVRYTIANGFRTGTKAVQPLIQQRPSVQGTLEQLPPTLATASSQLPAVNRLVSQVTGFARAAEPTLVAAPGALGATTRLLQSAQPGLRSANATLALLHRAVDPTLRFLHTTRPELPRINSTFSDATPVIKYVAPRACGITDTMDGWSDFMNLGDTSNHFIRFTVAQTTGIFTGSPGALGPAFTSQYPGPCNGTVGEVGGNLQTPEQQVAHLNSVGFPTK